MSRIDEIRERLHAYNHITRGVNIMKYDLKASKYNSLKTHALDMDYLLTKIERYETALTIISNEENWYITKTGGEAWSSKDSSPVLIAEEALKEEI